MDNGLGSLLDIVAEMARKGLGMRTTWDYMVRLFLDDSYRCKCV